jgi:hypothetical protein
VPGGGEPGHIDPDLGDELLSAGPADAGNLIELINLPGARGQDLIDPRGQRLGLGGNRVDPVQHHPQPPAVMVAELAGQRLLQDALLTAHGPAGQLRQHRGIALPGDQRLQHVPPGLAEDAADHRRQLDLGVSSSFSARCFSRVRSWIKMRR